MKHTKLWFILLLLAVLTISCEEDDKYGSENPINPNPEETGIASRKAYKNPYSIENMEEAFANLIAQGSSFDASGIRIEVTHLYVKFASGNSNKLDLLKAEGTLDIYDYDILTSIFSEDEHKNKTSNLSKNQYTVMPLDYPFREGISYEIIESMYIPGEEDNAVGSEESYEQLENKVLGVDDLTDLPEKARKIRILFDAYQ